MQEDNLVHAILQDLTWLERLMFFFSGPLISAAVVIHAGVAIVNTVLTA